MVAPGAGAASKVWSGRLPKVFEKNVRAPSKLPEKYWQAFQTMTIGAPKGAAKDHERQGGARKAGGPCPPMGGHRLDRWREAWYPIYIHFHMKYKENLFAPYEYQSRSGPSGLRLELPAGAVRRDIEQRSLYPSEEQFKFHHIFRKYFLRN